MPCGDVAVILWCYRRARSIFEEKYFPVLEELESIAGLFLTRAVCAAILLGCDGAVGRRSEDG